MPTQIAGQRLTLGDLPPTQRQVLVALARPYKHDEFAVPATNQEIADELHLSVDAVKSHLRTLFQRFGIEHLPQNQKRSRLVAEALQAGVVSTRDLSARRAPHAAPRAGRAVERRSCHVWTGYGPTFDARGCTRCCETRAIAFDTHAPEDDDSRPEPPRSFPSPRCCC